VKEIVLNTIVLKSDYLEEDPDYLDENPDYLEED
jgi:hypothetical protein